MSGGISRSFLIGAATILAALIAQGSYLVFFCAQHAAWVHAHTGQRAVRLMHSYAIPRPGDAIFVCDVPHKIGSLVLHTDLECDCAPSFVAEERIARETGAVDCALKDAAAADVMLARACAPSYCDQHLDPPDAAYGFIK